MTSPFNLRRTRATTTITLPASSTSGAAHVLDSSIPRRSSSSTSSATTSLIGSCSARRAATSSHSPESLTGRRRRGSRSTGFLSPRVPVAAARLLLVPLLILTAAADCFTRNVAPPPLPSPPRRLDPRHRPPPPRGNLRLRAPSLLRHAAEPSLGAWLEFLGVAWGNSSSWRNHREGGGSQGGARDRRTLLRVEVTAAAAAAERPVVLGTSYNSSPITPFPPSPRSPHHPVPPIISMTLRTLVQLQEAWRVWAGNSDTTTACSAWTGGEGELLLQGEYGELKLENVLLVEKLSLNLISQTQLDSTGCKTFSDKGKLWVFNEDWKVVAEGNRNQGLYEMKLRKKGLEDENATYLPSLEGDLAREELKARLGGLPVKELQQEASAMVVGMEKNRLPTKGLRADMTSHEAFYGRKPNLGFARVWGSMVQYREPAGPDHKLLPKAHWGINLGTCPVSKGWVIKDVISGKVTITRDVVFYEEVNYLQWKGVEKEIAAARTATAPDKVEDLLEEKESEGAGYEGDEELEDVERADSVDWVWEKAPTSEADETNGVEIAGEQPSNEVAEGGNEEVVGEGDEESAAEGDSDPWKLLNSDDSNVKMREIEELLEEGAIVIGREVKNGEGKALADSSEDEAESPAEELGKGKRVKKPNPRY
ncbi:unnamed protein product [Closterium sp. NIES-64]|nr:unnamed protein product [Closterium sp. NIES-64]